VDVLVVGVQVVLVAFDFLLSWIYQDHELILQDDQDVHQADVHQYPIRKQIKSKSPKFVI
jgi:hypothetical protein